MSPPSGDIKGVGAVAAGARDLQRVHFMEQLHAVGMHPGGGDLADRLPLHGQGHEVSGGLDRGGLTAHTLFPRIL